MPRKSTPKPAAKPSRRRPTEAPEQGLAWCSRHQEWEDAATFANDKSSKTGKYGMCKTAEAEWRVERKAALAAGAPPVVRAKPKKADAPAGKQATAPKATPAKRRRKPSGSEAARRAARHD